MLGEEVQEEGEEEDEEQQEQQERDAASWVSLSLTARM